MSIASNARLSRLLRLATGASLVVALLALPVAGLLTSQAQTVQYISAFDEGTVEVNRYIFEEDAVGGEGEIVSIYGTPSGEPEQVLFVSEERILHPRENPKLALLAKLAGENPLQVQTVWFVGRAAALGAGLAGLVGVGLVLFLRRRQRLRLAVAS